VIGVVSDIRYRGLDASAGPSIYVLWNDHPAGQPFLAVRTSATAASLAPALRTIRLDVDPRMPLMPVRTLDEVVQRSVADERLARAARRQRRRSRSRWRWSASPAA
jgi:hypothetical protein